MNDNNESRHRSPSNLPLQLESIMRLQSHHHRHHYQQDLGKTADTSRVNKLPFVITGIPDVNKNCDTSQASTVRSNIILRRLHENDSVSHSGGGVESQQPQRQQPMNSHSSYLNETAFLQELEHKRRLTKKLRTRSSSSIGKKLSSSIRSLRSLGSPPRTLTSPPRTSICNSLSIVETEVEIEDEVSLGLEDEVSLGLPALAPSIIDASILAPHSIDEKSSHEILTNPSLLNLLQQKSMLHPGETSTANLVGSSSLLVLAEPNRIHSIQHKPPQPQNLLVQKAQQPNRLEQHHVIKNNFRNFASTFGFLHNPFFGSTSDANKEEAADKHLNENKRQLLSQQHASCENHKSCFNCESLQVKLDTALDDVEYVKNQLSSHQNQSTSQLSSWLHHNNNNNSNSYCYSTTTMDAHRQYHHSNHRKIAPATVPTMSLRSLKTSSDQLQEVTTRHKKQIEQLMKESVRFQQDMFSKQHKLTDLCQGLNDEAATRKEETEHLRTSLIGVTNERDDLALENLKLRAAVEVHQNEIAALEKIREKFGHYEAFGFQRATEMIEERDITIENLTHKLSLALDTMDQYEYEKQQQRKTRQIFFPPQTLPPPLAATTKTATSSSTSQEYITSD